MHLLQSENLQHFLDSASNQSGGKWIPPPRWSERGRGIRLRHPIVQMPPHSSSSSAANTVRARRSFVVFVTLCRLNGHVAAAAADAAAAASPEMPSDLGLKRGRARGDDTVHLSSDSGSSGSKGWPDFHTSVCRFLALSLPYIRQLQAIWPLPECLLGFPLSPPAFETTD